MLDQAAQFVHNRLAVVQAAGEVALGVPSRLFGDPVHVGGALRRLAGFDEGTHLLEVLALGHRQLLDGVVQLHAQQKSISFVHHAGRRAHRRRAADATDLRLGQLVGNLACASRLLHRADRLLSRLDAHVGCVTANVVDAVVVLDDGAKVVQQLPEMPRLLDLAVEEQLVALRLRAVRATALPLAVASLLRAGQLRPLGLNVADQLVALTATNGPHLGGEVFDLGKPLRLFPGVVGNAVEALGHVEVAQHLGTSLVLLDELATHHLAASTASHGVVRRLVRSDLRRPRRCLEPLQGEIHLLLGVDDITPSLQQVRRETIDLKILAEILGLARHALEKFELVLLLRQHLARRVVDLLGVSDTAGLRLPQRRTLQR